MNVGSSNANNAANAASADTSAAQLAANVAAAGYPTHRTTLTQAAQTELSVSTPSVTQMVLDSRTFASPLAHFSSAAPDAISSQQAFSLRSVVTPAQFSVTQNAAAEVAKDDPLKEPQTVPATTFTTPATDVFNASRVKNFGVPVIGDSRLGLTLSPGAQVPAPGALPDLLSGTYSLGLVTSPGYDFRGLDLKDVTAGAFVSTNLVELGNGESLRKQGVTIGAKIEGEGLAGGRVSLSFGVTVKDGVKPTFPLSLTVPVDLSGAGPIDLPTRDAR